MTSKTPPPPRELLLSMCAEPGEDDGVSPNDLRRLYAAPTRRSHHRLCGRIRRILDEVLCTADDPFLATVMLSAVEPAPDASRMRVTVDYRFDPDAPLSPDQIVRRLEQARGWLRAEIALRMRRKRVPDLCFVAVPHSSD